MKLSDLRDKRIRTLDGESLGRVHDVHCDKGKITALASGPGSLLERLTAKNHGRRIPWECVVRIEPEMIVVTSDPLQRRTAKQASAPRNQRRTRQASGRPSRR